MRIEEIRRRLTRACARRAEIEQATLTRVSSISDPKENPDPEYSEGSRPRSPRRPTALGVPSGV